MNPQGGLEVQCPLSLLGLRRGMGVFLTAPRTWSSLPYGDHHTAKACVFNFADVARGSFQRDLWIIVRTKRSVCLSKPEIWFAMETESIV